MKIKFGFILLSFLLVVPSLQAQDEIRVTSTFDKRSVSVNEEIRLTIKVTGASGNVQAPRLPVYKDFDAFYTGRASHMTFVNGKSSSSTEFSYVLVPRKAGQYNLDPIEMTVNGRSFRTNAIQIEVTPGSSTQQQAPQRSPYASVPPTTTTTQQQNLPSNFKPNDENIFVRASIDKTSVYPNEQILLTYSLYTRYDTRYEGFEEEPQVSGFWIEEFPAQREVRRETVRVGGKRYVKADIKKMALFPTTAADYTIQPGTIKVSIRQEPQNSSVFDEFFNDSFFSGGSFFARRENRILRPKPIALTVKPFPEAGKPEDFQGAVGNFRMQATVDKREVKQNEPVTVTLVVEGEGNIETLTKPAIPDLPQFKVYETDTSSQLFNSGNVIGGKKTFEISFIPIEYGNLDIPALSFSFFNPQTASYQTLRTPVFPLNVEKSEQTFELPKVLGGQDVFKKEIEVEGRDIHFIWERVPNQQQEKILNFATTSLGGVNGFLFLLILFGLVRARQDKIFASDQGLKRRRFAKSQAEARLKPLKRLAKSENAHEYFEEVEKILTQYLSDKFNLSAQGITRMDLEKELEQVLGSEDSLYQEIMHLYQSCDEARFGKGSLPQEMKEKAMNTLRETMSRVEKVKR